MLIYTANNGVILPSNSSVFISTLTIKPFKNLKASLSSFGTKLSKVSASFWWHLWKSYYRKMISLFPKNLHIRKIYWMQFALFPSAKMLVKTRTLAHSPFIQKNCYFSIKTFVSWAPQDAKEFVRVTPFHLRVEKMSMLLIHTFIVFWIGWWSGVDLELH